MAYTLQLKRHLNYESKTLALAGLKAYLGASAAIGEPVIATYGGGESDIEPEKILLGIKGAEDYTIFDADAIPSEVQAALDKAISAIKGSTDEQIDDAYDTIKEIADALVKINGSGEGSIKKALEDAKAYTDEQFDTVNPLVSVKQVVKDSANYATTEADKYEFTKHTGAKEEVQLTFTPISPLALTIPEAIGDIAQGTTCESLNGKPLSELLDSILFKTIYPTVTNPSATVRFASSFTNNALMEAGLAGPTDANMAHTLNKGKVKVADGTTADQDYVGDETSCAYQMTYVPGAANSNAGVEAGGATQTNVALSNAKMTVGTYTFKAVVNYAQGPLMKTSKGTSPNPMPLAVGGTVANPHPAGSVTSGTVSLRITLPVFIDNQANGTFNKQSLQAWGAMTFSGIAMANQTSSAPTQIKTPRKLQSANSFNAVSGKYDVAQLSNYTMSETNENINGVQVKYYLYKWTGGALGAVNFEIKTY